MVDHKLSLVWGFPFLSFSFASHGRSQALARVGLAQAHPNYELTMYCIIITGSFNRSTIAHMVIKWKK